MVVDEATSDDNSVVALSTAKVCVWVHCTLSFVLVQRDECRNGGSVLVQGDECRNGGIPLQKPANALFD